jgi:hypothetical protein
MSLILQDYTEKSIALFGNTKNYVDELKELGGRFNPNLTHDDVKCPGWIFSNKKREQLLEFVEKVNDNKYVKSEKDIRKEDIVNELTKIRNDIDKLIKKL